MTLDTSLPNQFQEQFEQAIRDVIAGVSQTDDGITTRELPGPKLDDEIEIPEVPELDGVSITSGEGEQNLGVDLYLDPIPEGDVPTVPDDIATLPEEARKEHQDREATYLKELGDEYEELSESLLMTISAYCDIAEEERERWIGDEVPDFLCTQTPGGDFAVFTTYAHYPEHVEEVYAEGREDVARRLGLPY